MGELYDSIIHEKCEAELRAIKESLSLAYLSPDLFALNLMGHGHMAHISGEQIHIVKCLAVEVQIRENDTECYKQIPVIYKGQDLFSSRKTKILIEHGT